MSRKTPEGRFKDKLHRRLMDRFPGYEHLNLDAQSRQAIPDLMIIYKSHWAMLETKRSFSAEKQPNQEYYVDYFNKKSFAAFVNPENMEEVLDAMADTWAAQR